MDVGCVTADLRLPSNDNPYSLRHRAKRHLSAFSEVVAVHLKRDGPVCAEGELVSVVNADDVASAERPATREHCLGQDAEQDGCAEAAQPEYVQPRIEPGQRIWIQRLRTKIGPWRGIRDDRQKDARHRRMPFAYEAQRGVTPV